jgi:putative ABC transport system permease protein
MLRKALIIVQFSISVILIAGTGTVYKQLNYMRSQPPGFNMKQTLVLNGAGSIKDSAYQNAFVPFKNDLIQLPQVKSITASTSAMGKENFWSNNVPRFGFNSAKAVTLDYIGVDYAFIPAYEIKLVAGRNFSKDFPSDSSAAILNETAIRMLGFENSGQAINQKLGSDGGTTIIGVVSDYHTEALHNLIDPQMMILRLNARDVYSVKIQSHNIPATIAAIKKKWDTYFPNDPFSYYFLDEAFDNQYEADRQFEAFFTIFSLIAIIIACMGLLGLSSNNVLQRTKEIGVRKVLGASVSSIVMLLSKDYIKLVWVAFVVASPVAWYIMHYWLQSFPYRINISLWMLFTSGLLAVVIALATISFQAIKAAMANPVKSLRTE